MAKEAAIDAYKSFSSISSIKDAYKDKKTGCIHITWTRTDVNCLEKISFITVHTPPNFDNVSCQKVLNEKWRVVSPSQELTAVVTEITKEDKPIQHIEIWSRDNLKMKILGENLTKHGRIYDDDSVFGSFSWSLSERYLLYVAEKKIAKAKSYFSEASSESTEQPVSEGTEFEYRDDWGELLGQKYQPLVCVLDLQTKETTLVDWLPQNMSYGKVSDVGPRKVIELEVGKKGISKVLVQTVISVYDGTKARASWMDDDDTIALVGWNNEPYKLGLIYCAMRKNILYKVDLKKKTFKVLKDDGRCVDNLVASRSGKKLAILDCPQGGVHRHCNQLLLANKNDAQAQPLNICDCSQGLQCENLVASAWCSDEKSLLLTSTCASRRNLFKIDTEACTATKISEEGDIGSWDLVYVSVYGDILVVCSSFNQSQFLMVGRETQGKVEWKRVTEPSELSSSLKYSIHKIMPPENDFQYEYMLLQPVNSKVAKTPLIVSNHGGPHSLYINTFYWKFACFCSLGYSILLTNYRGSYGYGEKNINSLLGKIGKQDVNDIMAALKEVLEMKVIDESKMVVMGGSHGGFLTTQLIGQYPNIFKAAIALNSVLNFSSMLGVSDIPDWIFTELGFKFNWAQKTSEEMRKLQYERSPFTHVEKIETPLLIAIGEKDRRCPTSQSIQLYNALKGLGKPVKMYAYPNSSHPLSEPETDSDLFVNMVLWIHSNLNK